MGTYTYVSAATVLLLALVLWLGPGGGEKTTQVSLAAGWQGALLESGPNSWELNAGEALALPSGSLSADPVRSRWGGSPADRPC